MFDAKQYAKRSRQAAKRRFTNHLPWSLPISDQETALKFGGVMSCAEVRGPDPESCTPETLTRYHADINRVMKLLGTGYTMNIEVQCDPMDQYPNGDIPIEERWKLWPDHASFLLDEESRAQFEGTGHHVDVNTYMSITKRFPPEITAWTANILHSRAKHEEKKGINYRRHLDSFRQVNRSFHKQLSNVMHVRRLGYRESLEYLHSTVSTKRQRLGEPVVYGMIDRKVATQAWDGDIDPTLGGQPIRVLEITEWSKSSWPAMFAGLNRLGRRYRFCVRFQFKDQATSEKMVRDAASGWNQLRKNFFELVVRAFRGIPADAPGGDNKRAATLADEAEAAIKDIQKGFYNYGLITVALVLYGKDREDLDEQEAEVNSVLFDANTLFKGSDVNHFDAFLGTLPGHIFANGSWSPVSTINLAHVMPATSVWTGAAWNDRLGGPALLHVTTAGNMPFRINLHVKDVGHTAILGRTGSGKTTLLNRIRAAWRRYKSKITGKQARVITFEIGRGAVPITRAMGGKCLDLGKKGAIGLQPYRRIDQEIWRRRMNTWTLDLLKANGVTITPRIEDDVRRALLLLASNDVENRTMTLMQTYLQDEACQEALAKFTDDEGQPYGYLFDHDNETLELEDVVTFEMGKLFDDEAICIPTLTYLFWIVEDSLDGTDTLIVVDEGWKFLMNSMFAKQLDEWLRTMRKQRGVVVFATQNLRDIVDNSLSAAASMLNEDNFPTKILLANESAASNDNQRAFYSKMNCNPTQIEIVASLEPAREAYFMNVLGARRFSMNLGPVGISLCGKTDPEDLILSDRLAALTANDPPGSYLRHWLHATLPHDWAVDAVGPLNDNDYQYPRYAAAE